MSTVVEPIETGSEAATSELRGLIIGNATVGVEIAEVDEGENVVVDREEEIELDGAEGGAIELEAMVAKVGADSTKVVDEAEDGGGW